MIGPRRPGVSRGGCRPGREQRSSLPVGARPTVLCGWQGLVAASPVDDRQGAAPSWLLATAAPGRSGSLCPPLRARPARRAPARGHQATRPLLGAGQAGARRRSVGGRRNRRGWQHLHVAIDDHSRVAYAELLPRPDAENCVRFLERARLVRRPRHPVERVLTDNAKAYHARAWISAASGSGSSAATPALPPRTNGKAERLIQTLLREWAYAAPTPPAASRARALAGYLRWYNRRDRTARSAPDHQSAASHTSLVTTASSLR